MEKYQEMNAQERDLVLEWSKIFIRESEKLRSGAKLESVLKVCANAHYERSEMDKVLSSYEGKIYEFIEFIEKEWSWKIKYDECAGVLIADENKDYCVCPMVKYGIFDSTELCNCSVGFAERMFSKVFMRNVKATVDRSFLRDHKSCVYRINVK